MTDAVSDAYEPADLESFMAHALGVLAHDAADRYSRELRLAGGLFGRSKKARQIARMRAPLLGWCLFRAQCNLIAERVVAESTWESSMPEMLKLLTRSDPVEMARLYGYWKKYLEAVTRNESLEHAVGLLAADLILATQEECTEERYRKDHQQYARAIQGVTQSVDDMCAMTRSGPMPEA